MIKKIYRLTTKDIKFLYKKQFIINTKNLSFFYFLQYPNKKYNQIAINIPLKLSKNSTTRNFIKRSFYNFIRKTGFQNMSIGGKFYKIFVSLNKNGIVNLKKNIETKDKKVIKTYIINDFNDSLTFVIKKIGK